MYFMPPYLRVVLSYARLLAGHAPRSHAQKL
jgi:hypothetical protein